jgi:hypothetical protein
MRMLCGQIPGDGAAEAVRRDAGLKEAGLAIGEAARPAAVRIGGTVMAQRLQVAGDVVGVAFDIFAKGGTVLRLKQHRLAIIRPGRPASSTLAQMFAPRGANQPV